MKTKGATMMKTYLERGSDDLDGFEFLTMAEAGEVGHWSVLEELNKQAKNPGVQRPRQGPTCRSRGVTSRM